MEPTSSAINATRLTIERLLGLFGGVLHSLITGLFGRAVCRSLLAICLLVSLLSRLDFFAFLIINVSPDFQIEVDFRCWGGGGCSVGGRMWFTRSCEGVRPRLERLETTRGVGSDTKMTGERWSDI